MKNQDKSLSDEEFYNKYHITREEVKDILYENSVEKDIYDYTHR